VSLSVPMHPGRTRWDRDRRRFRTPPRFPGYVGFGLADGVAVGNVFASPSAEQILDATREVHGDAGVLYLYGNYSGDVMNFDFAAELAGAEGIEIATVLGADDVASAPRDQSRAGGESPASPCCTRWRALGQKRVLRSPRWWPVPTPPVPGCVPWAWLSRRVCCLQLVIPHSNCRKGRWRSAWDPRRARRAKRRARTR